MKREVTLTFQPAVSRLLTNAVNGNRLHSAYLFVGDEGYGKWFAASEFAAQILTLGIDDDVVAASAVKRARGLTHSDLHILHPTPSPKNKEERGQLAQHFRANKRDDPFAVVEFDRVANILVDNVRATRNALYRTPAEGGYRVAIVHEVERMPDTSFDILLKTIEEPPSQTVMILTTSNFNRLPATIISRCQKVRFLPVPASEIAVYLKERKGVDSEQAEKLALLANGSFTEAYRLVSSDIDARREQAIELMRIFITGSPAESATALADSVNFRNREEALDLIRSWTWLLRDVCILGEGLQAKRLINSDQHDTLRVLASYLSDVKSVHKAMTELLETRKLFYRNVSPRTALTQFAWKLNDIVRA